MNEIEAVLADQITSLTTKELNALIERDEARRWAQKYYKENGELKRAVSEASTIVKNLYNKNSELKAEIARLTAENADLRDFDPLDSLEPVPVRTHVVWLKIRQPETEKSDE